MKDFFQILCPSQNVQTAYFKPYLVIILNALVMSMKSMHVAVNLQANMRMRLTFVFYDAFKSLCM